MLYVFGAFLLLTGIKMWWAAGQEPDLGRQPGAEVDAPARCSISPDFDGEKFFTVRERRADGHAAVRGDR